MGNWRELAPAPTGAAQHPALGLVDFDEAYCSRLLSSKRNSLTFKRNFYAMCNMDIELARTFIEIVATGSFIRASERLNVAQTTVSARIRNLEQQLGRALFVRHKGGASLTPAGEQFLRHAPMFVQLWQRTLHQVAVPPGRRAVLTVGSEVSLAQPLLLDWVRWMRGSLQDSSTRRCAAGFDQSGGIGNGRLSDHVQPTA
jgi:hypothetical protein